MEFMSFPVPTDEDIERARRQAAYTQSVRDQWAERRRKRREQLLARADAIRNAITEYRRLEQQRIDDPDASELTEVRIRSGFVRLKDERTVRDPEVTPYVLRDDKNSRPPMSRLIIRKNHSLPVWMSLIYVAHLEAGPGQLFTNRRHNVVRESGRASWTTLCGITATAGLPPTRIVREKGRALNRALSILSREGLVVVRDGAQSGRFGDFLLQREDAPGRSYEVPGEYTPGHSVLTLPLEFFRHGWHLVLEPAEIATLLAIVDLTERTRNVERNSPEQEGVGLNSTIRWERYGLSAEAYESIHQLDEFGLIDVKDPMPKRRFGKLKPQVPDKPDTEKAESQKQIPYRLIYPAELAVRYRKDAVDVVLDRLSNPQPLRFSELVDDRWATRQRGE